MSEEMTGIWDAVREQRQEERAEAKVKNTDLLRARGVRFEARNDGHHLIVRGAGRVVDFWPASGKWIVRHAAPGTKDRRGYDIESLLKMLGAA